MAAYCIPYLIKVLPENNVVLVDSPGLESEFFMPQIVKGRISFQNIIPNRRCCGHVANGCEYSILIAKKPGNYRITKVMDVEKPVHAYNSCPPLAKSTPLNKASGKTFGGKDAELTPEIIRGVSLRNVDDQSISYLDLENSFTYNKESTVSGNSSESRDRLNNSSVQPVEVPTTHRSNVLKEIQSVENWRKCITPVRVSETITSNRKAVPVADMQSKKKNTKSNYRSNNSSGFNLPSLMDIDEPVEVPATHRSNVLKEIQSVDNWRKCITPVRTYERRRRVNTVSETITSNKKAEPVTDIQSKKKTNKVGTKPPNPSLKMVVKRRKLIIDKKKHLSDTSMRNSLFPQPVSKKSNPKHLALAKTRKQYEALKTTAFDLLISSNHTHIADKLQNQFRHSCVHKGSSTHPSYKHLTDLPPLQLDKEVQKLQRQTARVR